MKFSYLAVLALFLIALQAMGAISAPWWVILMPVWIGPALVLALTLVFVAAGLVAIFFAWLLDQIG